MDDVYGKLIFMYIVFSVAFVPGIIYTSYHTVRRETFFDQISFAVFRLCCFIFVAICPLSVGFYFLYRWLFKVCKQALNSNDAVTPKSQPTPVVTNSDPTPVQETPLQDIPVEKHALPAPFRVCRFIWINAESFAKSIFGPLPFDRLTYLWTALFYVLIKQFRSQTLADDIYAQFSESIKALFSTRLPGSRDFLPMLSAYNKFRAFLNSSEIDPTTDDGMEMLWGHVQAWAFPESNLPQTAFNEFRTTSKMVNYYTQRVYASAGRPLQHHSPKE